MKFKPSLRDRHIIAIGISILDAYCKDKENKVLGQQWLDYHKKYGWAADFILKSRKYF